MAFLSKKKQVWSKERAKSLMGVLVGSGITKNSKADIYYRNAVDKETRRFILALINELEEGYPNIRVNNESAKKTHSKAEIMRIIAKAKKSKMIIYQKNMYKIVQKWLRLARNNADKSIKKSLSELAGKQISIQYDKSFDTDLKIMIERNVQLITNATTQTLTNIENIVYDGMTNGEGWKSIKEGLKRQPEISAKRIKLIARDQTAKTNQALNSISQQSAGIKYFMWKTMQDERVSEGKGGHRQLNNKIYKWGDTANYPIIDAYGNRGIPSQRVNCRCDARAVWILDGYKPRQLPDGSYEVVKSK